MVAFAASAAQASEQGMVLSMEPSAETYGAFPVRRADLKAPQRPLTSTETRWQACLPEVGRPLRVVAVGAGRVLPAPTRADMLHVEAERGLASAVGGMRGSWRWQRCPARSLRSRLLHPLLALLSPPLLPGVFAPSRLSARNGSGV